MKKKHVQLTASDQVYLENLLKKGSLPVKTYRRSMALLELDRGHTYKQVSDSLGVTVQTASIWAKKYKEGGLDFLQDKPRSGRPLEIDGIARAKITALACSDAPEGYGRWTLELLAERAVKLEYVESISYVEVSRILKKMNLSLT